MMYGGQQQNGIRPGTEAVGAIVAMSIAFASANDPSLLKERTVQFRDMTDAIWKALLPFVATGLVLPTGENAMPGRVNGSARGTCVL